jgi:hypothetical protein
LNRSDNWICRLVPIPVRFDTVEFRTPKLLPTVPAENACPNFLLHVRSNCCKAGVDGHIGPCVGHAAQLPAAEGGINQPGGLMHELPAPSERQVAERAQVEAVADAEVVAAPVRTEVEGVAGRDRFVRAA